MNYSEMSIKELRNILTETERVFNLIWESPDGQVVTGLGGKIGATDGLARRIKAIYQELENRK